MSYAQSARADVEEHRGVSSDGPRQVLNQTSDTVAATTAIAVVLLSTFALTASMNGLDPVLPAIVGGVFLFVLLVRQNPSWIVHAMLIVLFTTTVPEIPRGLRVGGIFVYFNEMFIFGSLLYAGWLYVKNRQAIDALRKPLAVRIAHLFCGVIVVGFLLAAIRGYPLWDIQYDVKSVVELVMVVFVSFVVAALDDWRRYVKTITAILWFSAILMVYASVTGFVLWGRTETAQLYAAGGRVIAGGSDAVRFLTATSPLALAVVLGSVALLMVGRVPASRVMPTFVPSLLISVLSFSRTTILALAATILFALLVSLTKGHLVQLLLRLALVPFIVAALLFGASAVGGAIGAGDWIDTQTTGYMNRVIAGFDESNEQADTSAGYREQENAYVKETGAKHPLLGGGFGTHYKPPTGKRDTFQAFEGTLYSHNAYNWFYIKVGALGVGTFIVLLAACVLPVLRRKWHNPLLEAAAGTLVGLSIAMLVTPMPIEQPGSAVVGILMGVAIGANAQRDPQSDQSRRAEQRHIASSDTRSFGAR